MLKKLTQSADANPANLSTEFGKTSDKNFVAKYGLLEKIFNSNSDNTPISSSNKTESSESKPAEDQETYEKLFKMSSSQPYDLAVEHLDHLVHDLQKLLKSGNKQEKSVEKAEGKTELKEETSDKDESSNEHGEALRMKTRASFLRLARRSTNMYSKEVISEFSVNELADFLRVFENVPLHAAKVEQLTSNFIAAISKEIGSSNPGYRINSDGIMVQRKALEGHAFAQILSGLLSCASLADCSDDILDLQFYAKAYLEREGKNLSLEDYSTVLNSWINHWPPVANLHQKFVDDLLPQVKIRNHCTMTVIIDLLCKMRTYSKTDCNLKDRKFFQGVLDYLASEVPYLAHWPNKSLLKFVPQAAMSLSLMKDIRAPQLWSMLVDGLLIHPEEWTPMQIASFMKAYARSGNSVFTTKGVSELFDNLQSPELLKSLSREDFLHCYLAIQEVHDLAKSQPSQELIKLAMETLQEFQPFSTASVLTLANLQTLASNPSISKSTQAPSWLSKLPAPRTHKYNQSIVFAHLIKQEALRQEQAKKEKQAQSRPIESSETSSPDHHSQAESGHHESQRRRQAHRSKTPLFG